jgi:NTE family protein
MEIIIAAEMLEEDSRPTVALCLSGGGYRATLFHLGAIRRLNELGVLHNISTISSVSGGSVASGYLAQTIQWPLMDSLPAADWNEVERGLRRITTKDIRTWSLLKRGLPWKWFDSNAGVDSLGKYYTEYLGPLKLNELPGFPNFVFCASDMAFGVNWVFEKERVGSYQAGYCDPVPDEWTVAHAVSASSCFPPAYHPMSPGFLPAQLRHGRYPQGPERDKLIKRMQLTDGGVYDNLAMEPVIKSHDYVLVSDGGALFDYEARNALVWRLKRYVAIMGNQATAVRKRWFISDLDNKLVSGTYWGIGSSREKYGGIPPRGYSTNFAKDVIAKIRTDFDCFSDAEAGVLQNHGYFMADIAIRTHTPNLMVYPNAPLIAPFGQFLNETQMARALRGSSKTKWYGHWTLKQLLTMSMWRQ